jgi:hypothetical protein
MIDSMQDSSDEDLARAIRLSLQECRIGEDTR